ncbi:ergosterol biosynthesis ERG4/ERG24 [Gorgonomyces haynaldii]|nr:ergosterol biosynthesis ERG4/ERG24 [Gorgonomyces haynaldii]
MSPAKKSKQKQHVTTTYEFMGPHGTILAILGLPVVVIALYVLCDDTGCPPSWWMDLASYQQRILSRFLWSWEAAGVYTGWILFHFALAIVLPGKWAKGVVLPTGEQLNYKINGLNALFVSVGAIVSLVYYRGLQPLLWLADHYFELALAGIAFVTLMSLGLYLASLRSDQVLLARGGNSGYPWYDFWMGRELNPRLLNGLLDLKFVCELRPGLIGWVVLNTAFAAKQYESLGYVTNALTAVYLFQAYYVLDAIMMERAILTTMDITTDGFGYMLCFGDLVWVPFTYSLQARYLADYPRDLPDIFFYGVIALNLIGLYIFRASNSEKNAFRTNPHQDAVKHLKYITTKSGSRLLVSGWWGAARKINYLGDWLMSLAWCLPCGFETIIPYFYCIYFAILLIHRAYRDDHACREKYGKDWERYCKQVPYMFIPYVI